MRLGSNPPIPFLTSLATFLLSPPTRRAERPFKRVRCFRWIDSRVLPLCKLPSHLGNASSVAHHRYTNSLSLSLFTLAKPVDSTSALRRINVVKAAPLRPSSRYFGGEVSGIPRSLGRRTFSNEVARKLLPTIPPACDLRLRCFSTKAPCGAIRNSIPTIVRLFVEKSRNVWTRIWPCNKLEFLECRELAKIFVNS